MIEILDSNTQILGLENAKVQEYWSWAHSNILENTERGAFAEYLVAVALGIDNVPRQNWLPYDLLYKKKVRIEVKSSAYLQSWYQKELSKIIFGISKTRSWNPKTNEVSQNMSRESDVYVFCVYKEKNEQDANVLNANMWEFYIVLTKTINNNLGDQKTIGLSSLKRYCESISFCNLKNAIDKLVSYQNL